MVGLVCIHCTRPSSVGYSSPAFEITWINRDNSTVYTGQTEMKIRVRSRSEVRQGDSLTLSYHDGYTIKHTYLPAYYIKHAQIVDTVFTLVTKKNTNAFEDRYVSVRVKSGHRTATEKFDLGMSLLWLFNSGQCTYIDGRGNSYDFGSYRWYFKPLSPRESSTGIDYGYVNQDVLPLPTQRDSVYQLLRILVSDTSLHVHTRTKGTGLLQLKHGSRWKQDYLISNYSKAKDKFEDYLSKHVFN